MEHLYYILVLKMYNEIFFFPFLIWNYNCFLNVAFSRIKSRFQCFGLLNANSERAMGS